MKLFLSALCLCASGLLIYVSYKLIYAYTMIDQFHDASLKWIEALKEKDEDLENIQMILSQYEKPINFLNTHNMQETVLLIFICSKLLLFKRILVKLCL